MKIINKRVLFFRIVLFLVMIAFGAFILTSINAKATTKNIKVTSTDSSVNYYDSFSEFSFKNGDIVELLSGTYNEAITIDKDNVSILGPNKDVLGTSASRVKEATITNKITLNSDVDNLTLKGLKFCDGACIKASATGVAAAVDNIKHNHEGFNFVNNVVVGSNNSLDSGFIYFTESNYNYSDDITVDGSYFTGNFVTDAIIALNNQINLSITNSVFKDINNKALRVYDQNKGAAGDIIIENNEFINTASTALYFNWIAPIEASTYELRINKNKFVDIPEVAIAIRGGNNGDAYTNVAINKNEFNNVAGCVHYNARLNCTRTFSQNKIVMASTGDTYIVKFIKAAENSIASSSYPINGASNLYLSNDLSTVYQSADEITAAGFTYNEAINNIGSSSYASIDAYIAAVQEATVYSGTLTMVSGAQIRTEGVQGLRFACLESDYFKEGVEHGFYLVKGTYNKNELTSAISSGNSDIGGNKLIKKTTTGTDNTFAVTIYNITEAYYNDDISVIAYVKDGGNYTFSNISVTRNIYNIAKSAYEKGNSASYIKHILNPNQKIKVTSTDSSINYYDSFSEFSFKAGDVVELAGGTYNEAITIDKNNITVLGPNKNVSGNSISRAEEAVITNLITINADVDGLTLKGLKFTGGAAIKALATGVEGTKANIKYNHEGFNFINNVVEGSTNSLGDNTGFIYFTESNHNYSSDIVIDNSYFTGNFVNRSIISLNNHINLSITNSNFINSNKEVLRVYDLNKGSAGDIIIENCEFNNLVDGGLYFRWASPIASSTYQISICNNKFINIPYAAIGFRGGNNGEVYTNVAINRNEFNSVSGCVHYNLRLNCTRTFSQNKIVMNTNGNTYIVKFIEADNNGITQTTYPLDGSNNLYLSHNQNIVYTTADSITGAGFTYNDAITNIGTSSYASISAYNEALSNEDANTRVEATITALNAKYDVNTKVDKDITLDTFNNTYATTISWASSNENVLSSSGVYGRPYIDTPVKLTATVTYGIASSTVEYTYLVKKESNTVNIEVFDNLNLLSEGYDEYTIWQSSDESIVSVSSGIISAHSEGEATIYYTNSYGMFSLNVEVLDGLMALLKNANHEEVHLVNLKYGSNGTNNDVYEVVNDYYGGTISVNTSMMLNMAENEHTYGTFASNGYAVNLVVIHDTANTNAGADSYMHAKYIQSASETWHYSTDDKLIYQHVDEAYTTHQAGCGQKIFTLQDTGVKATGNSAPVITLDGSGYYAVNGISTTLRPYKESTQWTTDSTNYSTNQICQAGIYWKIGANGNYYLNKTYFNSTYNKLANMGGNTNGIAIEMCVNSAADIYHTWQRTAKLVAQILVRNNLTPHEVMPHNAFSGKPCAYSVLGNDRWDEFMALVETEYKVLKDYSDYTITFTPIDNDIIDSTGRVVNPPLADTIIAYKITIQKGNVQKEIILHTKICV